MADLTGQMLGRYRLETLLGRGGMAAVYRAFDEELRRSVAIKVILSEYVTDDNFIRRFKQEAELVAHLDHPNILPVFDFGEDTGRPYLVMPLRDGGSLESRMHGPIAPELALSFIAQVAEALDAAHAAGVLHRDVKPANVLLGKDNHVYLSDFGIAKMLESQKGLTATGMVVGTPTYMAPEQAAGKPTVPASDRYALAVMAFELLSGKPPFEGDSALAVLHQHVTAPVPPISRSVPGLPPSVDGVLRKALSKDPGDRHPSCREFARQLALSVAGQLYAAAVTGSPRTAPAQPEAPTEAMSIPVRTPAPVAPSLGTPKPSAVLTGAATVTAPAAAVAPVRKLWPLGLVLAVAAGVLLVIAVGGRKTAEKEAAVREASAPVPLGAELTPVTLPVSPVTPAPAAPEPAESAKVVVFELAPTAPSSGLAPPPVPPLPEVAKGPPPAERPMAAPPPFDAIASVLATWETFKPQVRYGHRPDMAEFQRALTVAEQALKTNPAAPGASALSHFAAGGVAYLSGDLEAARSRMMELSREAPPTGPFKQFREIPTDRGAIPDWALALSYLDPKREALDLLEKAEARGERGVDRGRRMLAKLEGEEPPAPGPGLQADGGQPQPPPPGERPRPIRDRMRDLRLKKPPQ